ncbi:MAG: ATP-binding cassette domain-containing protein, partial [Candidatus Sericytochromatia bacterium]
DLLAAVDKLGQLTDLPLEPEAPGVLPATDRPMAVALRDVVLAYPGEPPVLKGLDLTLRPGEAVGLVGVHGAGKTTLLEALFGLRLPEAGTITLDGVTMRELDLVRLRAQIELVREIELFDGTVLDNVRMGRPQVDEAAVRRALAAVNLLDRINELPEGLHTRLVVAGAPLSPGEARRLVLARSIAGRPRLLLLDEALGHLDRVSQASVLETIFADEAPWTVMASTYNRQALARCDRIFELRDGRLHEVTIADLGGDAGGAP